MKNFDLKHSDGNLLIIMNDLFDCYGEMIDRDTASDRHGKDFFDHPGFWEKSICEKIPDNNFSNYLITLCEKYGVIKELYIDCFSTEAYEGLLKSFDYKFGSKIDNSYSIFGFNAPRNTQSKMYSINFDPKTGYDFIQFYLTQWKNDKLYAPDKNFFKAIVQIKRIAELIFLLLTDCPSDNLFVHQKSNNEEIDFVAVMFFLEQSKDIEVLGIDATSNVDNKYTWQFKIKVLDKFFKDFQYNRSSGKVSFLTTEKGDLMSLEEAKEGIMNVVVHMISKKMQDRSELEEKAKSKFIEYDPNQWRFYYQGKGIHDLNQGGTPWEIFHKAFGESTPRYEFPHEKTPDEREVLFQNVKGFRRLLREKLKNAKAPVSLVGDILLKIDGGNIRVSKIFIPRNFHKIPPKTHEIPRTSHL